MAVSESKRYCLYACMSLLLGFGFFADCSSSVVDDPAGQIGSIGNNCSERETTRKLLLQVLRPNWFNNRKRLADCAIGFGKDAKGGRGGRIYVVTDSSDNDVVNPRPGTLRHAVIQTEPLWIIFARDMQIILKQELIMNSFKTIDGRGVKVEIFLRRANNGPICHKHYNPWSAHPPLQRVTQCNGEKNLIIWMERKIRKIMDYTSANHGLYKCKLAGLKRRRMQDLDYVT